MKGFPNWRASCLRFRVENMPQLKREIEVVELKLMEWHRNDECSQRLAQIPGVGPIGASMLMMKTPDPHSFKSGRDVAAWMGLTPKDHSTAGKTRLGRITRAGDELLHSTLVVGATSVIQQVAATSRFLLGTRAAETILASVHMSASTGRIYACKPSDRTICLHPLQQGAVHICH